MSNLFNEVELKKSERDDDVIPPEKSKKHNLTAPSNTSESIFTASTIGLAHNPLGPDFEFEDTITEISEVNQPLNEIIEKVKPGTIQQYWYNVINNSLGRSTGVPVMIARGGAVEKNEDIYKKYKVLGISAALHGNEINGIRSIQKFFKFVKQNIKYINGVIVAIIVCNPPGYMLHQREFDDGVDLNHCFPGNNEGKASQQYAFQLADKLIRHLTHFIDLHSASKGRTDSFYIRADMSEKKDSIIHKVTADMARVFNPDNIVNGEGGYIMRKYAMQQGIPAICVELGDPSRFQDYFIEGALIGLKNVARYLEIFDDSICRIINRGPVLQTNKSGWRYSLHPGILLVFPNVSDTVHEGDLIGEIYDIWGNKIESYYAQYDGVCIGKTVDPIVRPGDRFIHLGKIEKDQVSLRRAHIPRQVSTTNLLNTMTINQFHIREITQQLQTKEFRIQELERTSTERIESIQGDNQILHKENQFLKISVVALTCTIVGYLSLKILLRK